MLRDGPSEDDIREEAVEVYRAALKAEAARQSRRPVSVSDIYNENTDRDVGLKRGSGLRPKRMPCWTMTKFIRRLLDRAIELQATAEIADYCRRSDILMEPGTEPYREMGIKLIKAKIAAGVRGSYLPLPDRREILGSEQSLPPLPKIEPPIPVEPKPITDPPPPKRLTETFSEAFEKYLATELDGTSANSTLRTTGARWGFSSIRLVTCH